MTTGGNPWSTNAVQSVAGRAPFPIVVFDADTLAKLQRLVSEGCKTVLRGGVEVSGLLLGKRTAQGFRVDGCIAIPSAHGSNLDDQLSEADGAAWDDVLSQVADHDRIIGIFRSQTRPGMRPAPEDSWMAHRALPGRQGVFVLIKPHSADSMVASYFLCEGGAIVDELNAPREVEFGPGSAYAGQREGPRVLNMPGQPTRRRGELLNEAGRRTWKSRWPVWIAVSAVAAGIGGAVLFEQTRRAVHRNAAIKSPSEPALTTAIEKPWGVNETSGGTEDQRTGGASFRQRKQPGPIAQPEPRNRMVRRGARGPVARPSGAGARTPGSLKRFLRNVQLGATRLWPFRSNKTREQSPPR